MTHSQRTTIEIREEPLSQLEAYSRVSIAFDVTQFFDVNCAKQGAEPIRLVERRVENPYVKQYDLPGNSPLDWERQFNLANWSLHSAWVDGRRVGGAVVAFDTPGVDMLEGRRDLAVLWDLRVAPDMRCSGVATALVEAVERWSIARGCCELKVETQNINVPACRFYASRGFELRVARPGIYVEFPDEIMLLWNKSLAARP